METQETAPINPVPQPQPEASNSTTQDHSNNKGGAGSEIAQQPSQLTTKTAAAAGAPSVELARQEKSSFSAAAIATGVVAASSAAAENNVGGDGGVAPATGGAVTPGGAVKKEDGGSQAQPRSAKRSREANIPVSVAERGERVVISLAGYKPCHMFDLLLEADCHALPPRPWGTCEPASRSRPPQTYRGLQCVALTEILMSYRRHGPPFPHGNIIPPAGYRRIHVNSRCVFLMEDTTPSRHLLDPHTWAGSSYRAQCLVVRAEISTE